MSFLSAKFPNQVTCVLLRGDGFVNLSLRFLLPCHEVVVESASLSRFLLPPAGGSTSPSPDSHLLFLNLGVEMLLFELVDLHVEQPHCS